MKGFQLFFVVVFFHQSAGHVLQNQDGSSIDLEKEEFCTDVSQYSPKYYEDVTETCCTTTYVPNCQKKNKLVCMDVTNIICKPFAKPDYTIGSQINPGSSGPGSSSSSSGNSGSGSGSNNGPGGSNSLGGSGGNSGSGGNKGSESYGGSGSNDGGAGSGSNSGAPNTQCELVTDTVDMFESKPKDVVFKHTMKVPQCENVTSLNCETGWKVENGNKVWSGEENCEEVTWPDCKLVDQDVDFPATEHVHGPADIPQESFVTPFDKATNVRVSIPEMEIVTEPLCEPVVVNECVNVPYDDCSQPIRKEECRNFNVRKPKQDFIHKKKCLLPSDIERQTGGL